MVSKKVFKICFSKKGLLRWSHLPPAFSYIYRLSATKIKRKLIPHLFFPIEKHFFKIIIGTEHKEFGSKNLWLLTPKLLNVYFSYTRRAK